MSKAKSTLQFLFLLYFLLFSGTSFAGTIDLPQTGQTSCSDASGAVITCSGTGQDGDIKAGIAWPSPRFTDNGNGTITDTLTGLIWLQDANCFSTKAWATAVSDSNSLANGSCGLSDVSSAGDWRLPNVNELESLVNAEESTLATWLNTQGFTNVQTDNYWSATTSASQPGDAWGVSMIKGNVNYVAKSFNGYYVWPVRAVTSQSAQVWKTGQITSYTKGDDGDLQKGVSWPSTRFTDNGNSRVTDTLTGLIWLKDANCINTQYSSFDTDGIGAGDVTWQSALDFVTGINNGTYSSCGVGFTDWRLPNRKELQSLKDYSQYGPAFPSSYPFTNVQAHYWSATTYALSTNNAWNVDTYDGTVGRASKPFNTSYVWPVRAGIPSIPTLSEWGMVVFVLLLLLSGIVFIQESEADGC